MWTGLWGKDTLGPRIRSTVRNTAGCCRPIPTKSRPKPRREDCRRYTHLQHNIMHSTADSLWSHVLLLSCSWGRWVQETTTLRFRWWMRSITITLPRRWASITRGRSVWWSTAAVEASATRWPQVNNHFTIQIRL